MFGSSKFSIMSAMMVGASAKKEPHFRGTGLRANLHHSRAFSTSTFSSMEAALVLLRELVEGPITLRWGIGHNSVCHTLEVEG